MNRIALLLLLLLQLPSPLLASITVTDDHGNTVTLEKPAQRIISLAPSITELVFAVGAGEQLVGVVNFSDYPPEAKQLPIIGSFQSPDYERLIASQADLIFAWGVGNSASHIEKLKALGFTVYINDSREFSDIPKALRHFGRLTGNGPQGEAVAKQFEQRLQQQQQQYAGRAPVDIFYQVWDDPLVTVNREHFIGKVIELCGGHNIFAELNRVTPRPNLEAVLQADPQVIIASGMGNKRPVWLNKWQRWTQMDAVANGHVYFLHADLINRPTPRLLDAVQEMCALLEKVRNTETTHD